LTDNAGPLLFRAGLITREQLTAAYEAQRRKPGRTLVEQLVASGVVDEDKLCRFFHERLLVPIIGARELARPSRRALRLVPREVALEFRCVPLQIDEHKNLALAMTDPSDTHAVDELSFMTGMTVFRVAAPASAIAWALHDLYGVTTPLADAPTPAAPEPAVPTPVATEGETAVTTPNRSLPPALIVEDVYGDETPIPNPVPFDQTTGRIILIDPRSLAESLADLDRKPASASGPPNPHPVAESALHDAVLALEGATDRDAVATALVAYMRRVARRGAFFVVRRGELAGYVGTGVGIHTETLRETILALDRPSTFRDIVQTRMPFRGPVTDARSRDFLIDALGWAPTEMLAVPLSVRERAVSVLYGDEQVHPLPDEQLATLARAAELALERVLLLRKRP
jgi:hypothetical protein